MPHHASARSVGLPALLSGLSSAAALLLPGLALWLPSGYSWGVLLLLLGTLLGLRYWWQQAPKPRQSRWLLAAIAGMALIWLLDANPLQDGWRALDRPVKYLLALPCLLYALRFAPSPPALWLGLGLGASGSGVIALLQTQVQGLQRATGFTNAIQYGNLSLLLGLLCLSVLLVRPLAWRPWQSLGLAVAALLGLLGSLLSQSRGGWLALPLALALLLGFAWRWLPRRQLRRAAVLLTTILLLLGALKGPEIIARITQAQQEVALYQATGNAHSSVGQRLAHWQLAWQMGLSRPLLGWGQSGYEQEKQRRVAIGQVHPFVLEFGHAHNEVLDLFAKHGLLGVLALALLYGVPLVLFWPARHSAPLSPTDAASQAERTRLCLQLSGLMLPVCYFGFGLTQVFLAHNSGNLFYLFMVILIYSALAACRTLGVDSEKPPQQGQLLPDLPPHSQAMGPEDGEKCTAAVASQPTLQKSDRLLVAQPHPTDPA